MKQAHQHIRMLFLAYHLYPLAGTAFQILKTKSAPQAFRQPCRDGRCNHSEYGNAYTVALQNLVRFEVRLTRIRTDNIRPQHRESTIGHPTVVHSMSCFHIMISHIGHIITHEIHHVGRNMFGNRVNIVIVISNRLSLQNISVIYQNHIIAILLALFLDESMHMRQSAFTVFPFYKIIRKIISMYITGFNQLYCDFLFG